MMYRVILAFSILIFSGTIHLKASFPSNEEVLAAIQEVLEIKDYEHDTALGSPLFDPNEEIKKLFSEIKTRAEFVKAVYEDANGPVCSVEVKEAIDVINRNNILISEQISKISEIKQQMTDEANRPTFHTKLGSILGKVAPKVVQRVGKVCGYQYQGVKAISD